MKILHINYNDFGGGAANAARHLVEALRLSGIEAVLGVVEKKTSLDYVLQLERKRDLWSKIIRKIMRILEKHLLKNFSTSNTILHSLNIYSELDVKAINNSDYDLIHLHWVNNNTLSIKDIGNIRKPIIWTVHDSWAFSGAEHYQNIEELDERYKMGYSRNSKPLSTKGYDLCRRVFLLKKRYLQAKNIYFIAPSSKWKELIHTSSLFKDKECQVIPNIINHSVFVKKEKAAALGLIGINGAKKIIGFGAAYSITNKRSIKGGHLLLEALNNILEPESYTLIIFGPADQEFAKNSKVTTQFMGNIQNPHILATIYSLCDVFVCPSLVENLPYTCLEAICCGTPVVAFRTGGIPDIIEHKNNGYLAKPFEIEDLLEGILYCIREHDVLSENALRKSVHDFDTLNIVEQHKEIYSRTLDKRNMSI